MNGVVLDIPRIYTGIAEWLACVIYASLFAPRFERKWQIPVAVGCLLMQCTFLIVTDNVPIIFWIPCMATAFGMMVLQILLMTRVDAKTGCYLAVHAFVLAEFAAALQWQLHYYLWKDTNPLWLPKYGLLVGVFALVYIVSWFIASRLKSPQNHTVVTSGELVMLTPQICWYKDVYTDVCRIVQKHFEENETLTLGQLRDLTNSSRKYTLAVLEYYDKNKITKKDGDFRRLAIPFNLD
jgi:hypothetical protein